MKTTTDAKDTAFNKLYFVKLFVRPTPNGEIVIHDFQAARIHYPRLARIAESMEPRDLQYLIDKIESLL